MILMDLDAYGAALTPRQKGEVALKWHIPMTPGKRLALPRATWRMLHALRNVTFYEAKPGAPPENIGGEYFKDVLYVEGTSKVIWTKLSQQPRRTRRIIDGAVGVHRFNRGKRQGCVGWWFSSGQYQLPPAITDHMWELGQGQVPRLPILERSTFIDWS